MTDEKSQWREVAERDEIEPEEPIAVSLGDLRIALYDVDGEVFATNAICTHQHACLAEGFQEGEVIECPLHEGRFNIKTGQALGAPVEEDVATYEVKVEDGKVFVRASA